MGGSRLHLKTIEQMENDAKKQSDGSSNKYIRGIWLEVVRFDSSFRYKWGKKFVTREEAIEILKTVE